MTVVKKEKLLAICQLESIGFTENEPKNILFNVWRSLLADHNKKLFCEAYRGGVEPKIKVSLKWFLIYNDVEGKKRLEKNLGRRIFGRSTERLQHCQSFKWRDSTRELTSFLSWSGNLHLTSRSSTIELACFRELLEENSFWASDQRHVRFYPFIVQEEQALIKKEIGGKSVILECTTWMGETLAVVLRFVDNEQWVIQQRLVRLQLLAKSLSGEEIACELIGILFVDY